MLYLVEIDGKLHDKASAGTRKELEIMLSAYRTVFPDAAYISMTPLNVIEACVNTKKPIFAQ